MIRAAEEAATVAGAQGIQLPYASVSERVAEVASNTAANRSSMAQDIARGVPTEIQAIAGAIVARGREFNIATPINSAFFYLITNQFHQGEWRSQVKRLDRDLQLLFNALAKLANDI
jgi:2-dehydropantoate 2-reductase